MRFLNTNPDAIMAHAVEWYAGGKPDAYGNNRTGQRLGQYVYNKMEVSGPWPELFHERNPEAAMALLYAEMESNQTA